MLQTPDDAQNGTSLELDEFGVPTDDDALCTAGFLYDPGMDVFNFDGKHAKDPERAVRYGENNISFR